MRLAPRRAQDVIDADALVWQVVSQAYVWEGEGGRKRGWDLNDL